MRSRFMQAFSRHSFFERLFPEHVGPFSWKFPLKPLLEKREGRRSASSSPCPSRLSLDDEEDLVLWRRITDGFYFLHTVRTQGIEPRTVLLLHQVCCQRGCSLHVGVRRIVSGLTAGAQEALRSHLHTHITQIKGLFESCNRVALRNELLPKVALVASFENSADDGRVVQLLPFVKLVTTRVASRMIVRKIRVMLADGADNIPLHDLHVVDVIEQFHTR